MSLRKLVELTPEERRPYVAAAKTIILCTHGPEGYPHAVAMWFAVDEDETVWMTTYRKSQKAVNIRRNAKVALHVESGTVYDQLKGVLIRGVAELIDDPEVVLGILKRVHGKMFGSFPEGVDEAMRAQARKRVAIRVTPRRVSSWDHAKLAGAY
jgi:PPOX class probable F420-dependent enzyme